MEKDLRYFIASIVSISLALLMAFLDVQGKSNYYPIFLVLIVLFSLFFFLFLYYNYQQAFESEIIGRSLLQYKFTSLILLFFFIIGIAGSFVGIRIDSNEVVRVMGFITVIAVSPLVYAIIGWYDIRKKLGNASNI